VPDKRARARELAAEYIRKGDPTGWFDALYREAETGGAPVPWGDLEVNSQLIEFWQAHPIETAGKQALVIGSGLGDDAEQLAAWGFKTTGIDISKTAVDAAKKRFPRTVVEYVVADIFNPPPALLNAFDFVLEIFTVQSFPSQFQPKVIESIPRFLKPGGQLLVIARGRDDDEPEVQGPPWPVKRSALDAFSRAGLKEVSFEDLRDPEPPWVRRFRVLYRRPASS